MMLLRGFLVFGLAFLMLASVGVGELRAQEGKPAVPDLTKGGKKDNKHDWTLGATGARGWIWGWNLETTLSRQIFITKVEPGSPAAGKLEEGDVILGVNGKPFSSDARIAFATALTTAERPQRKAGLSLVRWRKGEQTNVTIQLKRMPLYSQTAPFDCPKSKQILKEACQAIARRGLRCEGEPEFVSLINALALLSSGEEKYSKAVQEFAGKVAAAEKKILTRHTLSSWIMGYANLFLTEYHLATGDKSVLPAIRSISLELARGQTLVGTWGHGLSVPTVRNLTGYGALNQAGLVCWLSLVLAQKCGVANKEVALAVDRATAFAGFYADKGCIPYGFMAPWTEIHDDNGRNAIAAVAFDLLGNKSQRMPADFFARTSVASYLEREMGHTGNFFSYLWGPLGAGRLGAEAVAAHLRPQRWFYDLARRHDGAFTYQGGAGESDSYTDWDMTGVVALTLALPLHKLYITGKEVTPLRTLSGTELSEVVDAGKNFSNWKGNAQYSRFSDEQLIKSLSSWSPTVQFRAAKAIASRPQMVPALITMLDASNARERQAACFALEQLGSQAAPAVDKLIPLLEGKVPWTRVQAAAALAAIGTPARKALPRMLRACLAKDPTDRFGRCNGFLYQAVFKYQDRGIIGPALEGVNRKQLHTVLKQMIQHKDGLVRVLVLPFVERLTDEDLEILWPAIVACIKTPVQTGEGNGDDELRLSGLELMAKKGIKEGLPLLVDYSRNQNFYASQERMPKLMTALKSYGSAARVHVPDLKKLMSFCETEVEMPEDMRKIKVQAVQDAIRSIQASKGHPKLRSIAELLR